MRIFILSIALFFIYSCSEKELEPIEKYLGNSQHFTVPCKTWETESEGIVEYFNAGFIVDQKEKLISLIYEEPFTRYNWTIDKTEVSHNLYIISAYDEEDKYFIFSFTKERVEFHASGDKVFFGKPTYLIVE